MKALSAHKSVRREEIIDSDAEISERFDYLVRAVAHSVHDERLVRRGEFMPDILLYVNISDAFEELHILRNLFALL